MQEQEKKERFVSYWNKTQKLLGGDNTIKVEDIEQIIETPASGVVDAKVWGADGYCYRMPAEHYYTRSVEALVLVIQREYEEELSQCCTRIKEYEDNRDRYESILTNIRHVTNVKTGI